MSNKPIYSVRLHLGDMGRELLKLELDSEYRDWLRGFYSGASGDMPCEEWTKAREKGFHFGACAFAEAIEFREGKSKAGSKSAEVRRETRGTAQPSNKPRTALEQNSEQTSNSARTLYEHCVSDIEERPRTAAEQALEQRSNIVRGSEQRSNSARTEHRTALEQSIEQASNQPTAYSLQPTTLSPEPKKPTTSEIQGVTLPPRAREPQPEPAATTWGKPRPSPNPIQRPQAHAPKREPVDDLRTPPEDAQAARRERWSTRRLAWIKEQGVSVDFTAQPGPLTWLSYCRAVHPSWQDGPARKAYDTLATYGWKQGGRRIDSWWQVADAWAENSDHSEHFERLPMGSMAAMAGVSEAMSAAAAGITGGEEFS